MNKRSQRSKGLAEHQAEQQFHEREWAIQRFGWAVLAAILVAAAMGVFGSGPLAKQTLFAGAARVEMDRFIRYNSKSEWRFVFDTAEAHPPRIYLDSNFVENYEITAITPEPTRSFLAEEFMIFEFENSHPLGAIIFHVEPIRPWKHAGSVRVANSPPIEVSQFVYP